VNVTDFASGLDKLRLNGDQLDNVGPTGNFAADGSGAGREMFIGVLHGAPGLDASDIAII